MRVPAGQVFDCDFTDLEAVIALCKALGPGSVVVRGKDNFNITGAERVNGREVMYPYKKIPAYRLHVGDIIIHPTTGKQMQCFDQLYVAYEKLYTNLCVDDLFGERDTLEWIPVDTEIELVKRLNDDELEEFESKIFGTAEEVAECKS